MFEIIEVKVNSECFSTVSDETLTAVLSDSFARMSCAAGISGISSVKIKVIYEIGIFSACANTSDARISAGSISARLVGETGGYLRRGDAFLASVLIGSHP